MIEYNYSVCTVQKYKTGGVSEMKKQLFGLTSALMLAFTSAPFAAAAEIAPDLWIKGQTPDSKYDYDVWNEAQCGTVTFEGTETNSGAFSCTWTDTHNCMFYKGHDIEMPKGRTYKDLGSISCEYAIDYSSDSYSEYGVHGWIDNCNSPGSPSQQVEYYIIDGYNQFSFGNTKPRAQFTDNGCTYNIYAQYFTVNAPPTRFAKYYSVIVEDDNPVKTGEPVSASHRIDVDKHFEAWEKAGMYVSGEVRSVAFYVSGYDSSGEANVTKNEIIISNPPEPIIPGDVNGDKVFNFLDCDLLRKWLLAVPDTELSCIDAGDFNSDDKLNAIDLSMMMRVLNGNTLIPIEVFELTPARTASPAVLNTTADVRDFYSVLPQRMTDIYGFKVYKDAVSGESWLKTGQLMYPLSLSFTSSGTVSFAVADLNRDGDAELYYTCSGGSGARASTIGYFDSATKKVTQLNYTYRGTAEDGGSSDKGTADMVFVEENGTLAVYAARLNIPDDPDAQNEVTKVTLFGTPTFKLGELTAENGIIQFMEAEVSKPLIRAEAT